ncbi:MAG: hypothetical protein ACJAWV_003115 [Flammeovirgaceae bacterium]|jgi:hypothetical protein
MDIISLITQIDDLNFLSNLRKEIVTRTIENGINEEKQDFQTAVVEITEGVSFEQILANQNYEPISFEEFQYEAEKNAWNHSLEEILNVLD